MALLELIVGAILKRVTPMIKDSLKKMILELERKAKATPNTVDDVLVDLIKDIFSGLWD